MPTETPKSFFPALEGGRALLKQGLITVAASYPSELVASERV